MIRYELEIFADYNQIYLHDESVEAYFSDSWGAEAYKNMAVVIDGAIGVATARNMNVLVEILIYENEQSLDIEEWEHAVS